MQRVAFNLNAKIEVRSCPRYISGDPVADACQTLLDTLQQLSIETAQFIQPSAVVDIETEEGLIDRTVGEAMRIGCEVSAAHAIMSKVNKSACSAWRVGQTTGVSGQVVREAVLEFVISCTQASSTLMELHRQVVSSAVAAAKDAEDLVPDPRTWFIIGSAVHQDLQNRTFISHRGPDLKPRLPREVAESHVRGVCFVDILDLPVASQSARRFIIGNLALSTDAIFLVTPGFRESDWCAAEAATWQALKQVREVLGSIRRQEHRHVARTLVVTNSLRAVEEMEYDGIFPTGTVAGAVQRSSHAEMIKEAMTAIKEWYPEHKDPPPRVIGLQGELTSGLLAALDWSEGIDMYALLSIGIQATNCLASFRSEYSIPMMTDERRLQKSATDELSQLETLVTKVASDLQSTVEAHAVWLRTQKASDVSAAGALHDLVAHTQYVMIAVTDIASEMTKTLLLYHDKLGLDSHHGCVVLLAFLAAASERVKDACGILLGQKERVNLPVEISSAMKGDMALEAGDLEFLAVLAIDDLADFHTLSSRFNEVLQAVELVGGHTWTPQQWLLLTLGIQEQYRLRRRAVIRAGLADEQVVKVLGAREIFVQCSPETEFSFADAALYLLVLIGSTSRTIVFVQLVDGQVIDRSLHKFRLKSLPHYSLKSDMDVYLLAAKSDDLVKMYARIRERCGVTDGTIDAIISKRLSSDEKRAFPNEEDIVQCLVEEAQDGQRPE